MMSTTRGTASCASLVDHIDASTRPPALSCMVKGKEADIEARLSCHDEKWTIGATFAVDSVGGKVALIVPLPVMQ